MSTTVTEAEILQVLQTAHPDEIPMSPEAIKARIEWRREWALAEADITNFALEVDAWMDEWSHMQSSKLRWIAVIGYLEKVIGDIRERIEKIEAEVQS